MDKDQEIKKWMDETLSDAPDGLGERIRARASGRTKRPLVWNWRWAFAASLVVALATLAFLIAPRKAMANTLRQVNQAIKDAKAMYVEMYVVDKKGQERLFLRTWYDHGNWRQDFRIGSSREQSYIWLEDKGEYWTVYPKAKVATVQPLDEAYQLEGAQDLTAVEYAKKITDFGPENVEWQTRIEPNEDVDGAKTFRIVSDRPDNMNSVHVEIVVNDETKYPIEVRYLSRVYAVSGVRPSKTEGIYRFKFNADIPREKFDMRRQTAFRVIELKDEWDKLKKSWQKNLYEFKSKSNRLQIYDVRIDLSGDIYVYYRSDLPWLKKGVMPFLVTDKHGHKYINTEADVFGHGGPKSPLRKAFDANGFINRASCWIPLEPDKMTGYPTQVIVSLGVVEPEKPITEAKQTSRWALPITPKRIGDLTSRSIVLGTYPNYQLRAMTDATCRGKYYFNKKDYENALRWYRQANELSTSKSTSGKSDYCIEEMVHCLIALNRQDELKELRKEHPVM